MNLNKKSGEDIVHGKRNVDFVFIGLVLKNIILIKECAVQKWMEHHNQKKDNDFAWASLICGLLIWVPLFNAVLGPLAIVFGFASIKRINNAPEQYGGQRLAIAGIILGGISTIFLVVTVYIKIFKPELLLA